ncbi:unnamed protein product [Microthlaspi erraticum]|uniref:Pentacotripeptide-repeat region of PRORP domain-containing protein n=1 Tax=Microthlaspi erraticum TaxID=1685480 RepID=A0A6D2JH74_9BRAS|nr:unnamed protein product [Microthlaspi erraticum]CAA7039185.1 unnamed protein product [Microthlaspi erraticum]
MGRRRRLLPPNSHSILTLLVAALKRKVQKSLPLASKPIPDPFFAEHIAYLKEMPNHPDVPRWRDIPALKDLLPVVSFSDVSELHLDLDPKFHKSVHCYASLLHVLTKHGVACDVPLIMSFMTHACVTDKDRSLVIDVYKQYKLASLALAMRICWIHWLDLIWRWHVVVSQQYVCKMIQSGLTPNLTTFTSLIMGYCRTGDADAALRVFQRNMVQQYGCVPDLKCYEQLMGGICEANKLGIAWMLLDCLLVRLFLRSCLGVAACCTSMGKLRTLLKI